MTSNSETLICMKLIIIHLRYIVVVHPLKAHYVSYTHVIGIIACIWLYSIANATPLLFFWRVVVTPAGQNGTSAASRVCLNTFAGTPGWEVYSYVENALSF